MYLQSHYQSELLLNEQALLSLIIWATVCKEQTNLILIHGAFTIFRDLPLYAELIF
jgi:hypothetical protein